MTALKLNNSTIGNAEPMTLMGGVNVLESESIAMTVAEQFARAASDFHVNWIFKGSFDKANRSSISSYRGPGIDEGLKILEKIKNNFDVPVITDIHESSQANQVAEICDIIQIPAFLCRQTDLVTAAAQTNKIIQFKKPQFLSAPEMKNVIEKCKEAGNSQIILCERGNSFGYNNLVVDMLNFQIMKNLNVPVIFDATHSLQLPGGLGNAAGGRREFLLPLAKAGLSQGIAGLFLEAHPNPDEAKCDGPCAIAADTIYSVISQLSALDTFIKQQDASS
ncbi:MAG: 3-deoxy-8-phosphooctulonate synthase [SAR86 cluster bacterium]|jgi:2-dehydro-3-deoxyphosphooctonate aldolase (KDO 8-P synthase)|nr:3-deoxy-8-phosphooctulonate synthase [Pseudomonadota bacterium]MDA8958075.1 3-deoxy-8-phosphooctulonate synthase [Gammaproteobacteria bacterium]MDO7561383.1 3-deoxy-8-phosphooctulonate synthase [SAR86 cluster bacterium]MDA9021680.1 3-deoxy-8-phosphooctulonate synthase [Gammaproteobacteria bacterium]MDA9024189.1 3-deoxy-8-phosphooctulonate synthase [Gammaproteobacteria bacterium]|tara:strand:+ start:406 stop:1239 length:834 start_codon:yes stop_codon:yes gene_type:complete